MREFASPRDAINRELLEALHEGRRAIGDHSAPSDCYATGPLTGNPIRDLVQCPACSFIAMYDAVIAKATREPDTRSEHPRLLTGDRGQHAMIHLDRLRASGTLFECKAVKRRARFASFFKRLFSFF